MMYKNTRNNMTAELVETKETVVILRMEDGEKEVNLNTFKRWWKPVETEEPKTMKMSDVVGKLEGLFDILNTAYFGSLLPRPVITVQSTPKAYGHCSTKKIWKSESEAMYEINIGAEFLNRPSANTAATCATKWSTCTVS